MCFIYLKKSLDIRINNDIFDIDIFLPYRHCEITRGNDDRSY